MKVVKSINVNKTNTLHQFDTAGIVGIQSPVGKVPIVFYVKEAEGRGRRGVIYYDDYDSVCFMFPENEHAKWCEQPYDMKYDAVETWDNGVEQGWHRNHGIFELWVSVLRKWYNGQVMFRPNFKIQGCNNNNKHSYPQEETAVEKASLKTVSKTVVNKTKKINHSCGCRKD